MQLTSQEYTERNLKGFEGDSIMKERIHQIIKDNKINTIIETGTFLGGSTKVMAEWVKKVYTIEIEKGNFNKASEYLKDVNNVELLYGSSEQQLDKLLSVIEKKEKLFLFLDAHFYSYNPLLDELATIKNYGFKPIIAIHDFKVPGRPELGFDVYKSIVYEWDWIKGHIEDIYGEDGYEIEYNSEATGAKRGIIYIFPVKKVVKISQD